MNLNSWDNQIEKPKVIASPTKIDPPKSDQSITLSKVRKDWKKKSQKEKQEKKEANTEDNSQAPRPYVVTSKEQNFGQNQGQN